MIRRIFCLFALTALISPAAIQYSGAVPTVATDTPATRTALVDFIKTTLTTAGWSCAGSTGDWKCTTASNANATGQIKVRIWDPASGVCAKLSLLNVSESIDLTTNVGFILADGSVWTVIANKYHVYGYSAGSINARHSFHAGTLYKPDFLTAVSTFGYLVMGGDNDTRATLRVTFRHELYNQATQQHILNSTGLTDSPTADESHVVGMGLLKGSFGTQGRQWFDDSYMIMDPLIYSDDAIDAGTTAGKWVGQLWDCLLVQWKQFTEGDTITYDSKTWRAITNGSADGTLFHYVPTP